MSFLGGLTSGSGGQFQRQEGSSFYTPHFYTPYQNFADQSLTNATNLRDAPFQPYDISKMFAPFQPFQNQAFGQVQNLQGTAQPYFDAGKAALGQGVTQGQSFFDSAAGVPTAQSASSPYFSAASQTWPGASSSYLNPYINDTVNSANKLLTQNFVQNTLPGINSQFIGSGGGAGGWNPAYRNSMDWATTNFNQNLNTSTQQALANAYNSAASIFGSDAARNAGLAGTAGSLALGQQGAFGNLGSQATGAGAGAAGAYGNLGTGALGAELTGTNALLQAGNQQQQQAQNPLTAAYQQFEQGQQWPYQTNSWAANTINQYQWPNAYSTNTYNNSFGSGSSQNSPLGTILGLGATLGSLAIPGAGGASAIGNLLGGLGGMFGGGLGGIGAGGMQSLIQAGGGLMPFMKRGGKVGYFGLDGPSTPTVENPQYFKWMDTNAFKSGGAVPVIKTTRKDISRDIGAARRKASKPAFGGVTRGFNFPSTTAGYFE